MEALAANPEFCWNMVVDESELMIAQLLGTYQDQDPSAAGIELMFHPDHDACSSDWMYNLASSLQCPTADLASTCSSFFPPTEFSSCELTDPNMMPTMETSSESMNKWHTETQMVASTLSVDPNDQFVLEDYCTNPQGSIAIAEHAPVAKRKVVEPGIDDEDEIPTDTPKEEIQRSAKNARNEQKEESNASYSSEENSNASQGPNGDGTGSNAKGKTRASRGSATEPQSLYARKRRERINERLRILQSLVPNGTKVDITTMLEEAVQYVKFLQLQIKLLSSDDMWMYAPLAYNGMDIGLDLKLPFPQQRQ